MPEISVFYGIRCTMYYDEHSPPHLHVEYAGTKALIDIQNAVVLRGALPNSQLKLVLGWCVLRQAELMDDWGRAKQNLPLFKIPPLK